MKENKLTKTNKERDIRPIIIYIATFFGIQLLGGFITGLLFPMDNETIVNKSMSIITIVSYFVTFLILVIVYRDKLIKDSKKMTKNNFLFIAITTIVLLVLNYVITDIFESLNVEMSNQDAVTELINYYKPFMISSVVLFAPLVEEMVFRYSLSTIFKNNVIFIIISSLIFGAMHGLGIVTIIYVLMGIILAFSYIKTDKNIISSIIIHIINNAFGVITMLIIFK